MTKTAAAIWRDYNIDGMPASLAYSPKKSDIRPWGAWVEAQLGGDPSDTSPTGPMLVAGTIAVLRNVDKTKHTRIIVAGYYQTGDSPFRTYSLDGADTTSADDGGAIIVGTDGGCWKLDKQRVSAKMFGAKDDGTDAHAAIEAAIAFGAANSVPLDFDGANFSVSRVSISGKSGIRIGCGGLVGIASSANDSIFEFINCVDVSFFDYFVINGNYNTNYSYGLHGYTNGAGQSLQYFNLNNVIFNACKVGWAFGSAARPDDTVSEISIFGGRTYACPSIGIGIGKNTVVSTHGCIWQSEFGVAPGSWGSLPNTGLEARGATLNITGGELLYVLNTTGSLTAISGVTSGSGNVYGNINVRNAVIECANLLSSTSAAGATAPAGGSILFAGNRMVLTTDLVGGAIQVESAFPGRVTVVGNSGFSTVSRTQWNINGVSNTTAIFTTDMQSFGVNCLQGYNGLNGGAQQIVIDGDTADWTPYTPTVTSGGGALGGVSGTGRYVRRGKTVLVQATATISSVGSATGGLKFSLPFTAAANNYVGMAYCAGTGLVGAASIWPAVSGTTVAQAYTSASANGFITTNAVTIEIEYELA